MKISPVGAKLFHVDGQMGGWTDGRTDGWPDITQNASKN